MTLIYKKFLKLKLLLKYHDYLYYSLNNPIISDERYDYLLLQFNNLKNKFFSQLKSYNQINHCTEIQLKKIDSCNHYTPMLSLNHTYDIQGFLKFYNKINQLWGNINFTCELKFDGLALSLLYKNGKLIRGLTRGNGIYGEEVTDNLCMIVNIPLILRGAYVPTLLEVRGEVCMLKKDLENLNLKLLKKKKKIFSNTRNAAAGSLRSKSNCYQENRRLFFYSYECSIMKNIKKIDSHFDRLSFLKMFGFMISPYILLTKNLNKILNFYSLIKNIRYYLSLNIDGIVVKIDSILLQNKIGYNNKFPKWAIALKFYSKLAKTKLLDVNYQISKMGIITPVANIFPTLLSGAIITKASLHNKHHMQKLNLYFNDSIIIQRVGDVIPKVKSVVTVERLKNAVKIFFPKHCPSCLSLLDVSNDKFIRCLAGINCLEQRKRIIEHFFSKNGLYAEGFSKGIISKLVEKKYIKIPLDCFNIDIKWLLQLKYFGPKSSLKIIQSIQSSRHTTLSRFIYALNIPSIGVESAKIISNHFKSFLKMMHCSFIEVKNIKNIGNVCANNFFNFMNCTKNINNINNLIKFAKISFIDHSEIKNINNKYLLGKKVVLSGKFTNFSREDMIQNISQLGGRILNKISNQVSFLIIGDKPGKKLMQAQLLNIKVIPQEEIYKLFLRSLI